LPLQIDGELLGVRLEVIGIPSAHGLQFRLCVVDSVCLCRLDYTDEVHANSRSVPNDGIPPIVNGPHYHSWLANRRFFRGAHVASRLYNAEPYSGPTTGFDSILRWFCAQVQIESLTHDHRIQLPIRDQLW
jgi:hypothetical protein